jgi:hypothetical protein
MPKQPRRGGQVSDRVMRSGQRVRVTRGPHEGRVGVVQAVSVDGAAVRLSADAQWPVAEVKVIAIADLVRAPRPRWRSGLTDAMGAPF